MRKTSLEASSLGALVGCQTQVPFAGHESKVAIVAKDFGKCNNSFVEVTLVAGHTSLRSGREMVGVVLGRGVLTRAIRPFDQVTESSNVVVSTCQDPVGVMVNTCPERNVPSLAHMARDGEQAAAA